DRCALTCQHAKLEIYQGDAGSALSSLYRSCSPGCLACTWRRDRRSPSFRRPSWWRVSDVAVLSFIRTNRPWQDESKGRSIYCTVCGTDAREKNRRSDHL